MKTISASDANRNFSALLREVASGTSVAILSHKRAVATLSPARASEAEAATQRAARTRLVARLRKQQVDGARDWQRDELYDH